MFAGRTLAIRGHLRRKLLLRVPGCIVPVLKKPTVMFSSKNDPFSNSGRSFLTVPASKPPLFDAKDTGDQKRTRACEFIERILGINVEDDLYESLKSGVLLCR